MTRPRGPLLPLLAILAWHAHGLAAALGASAPTTAPRAAPRVASQTTAAKPVAEPASAPKPVAAEPASADRAARPAKVARGAPFLWRIEGTVPAYLFGTIHVPDADVLALPPSVEAAFASAGAVYTEIPMDAATQFAALRQSMLPDHVRLKDVIGPALFTRLSSAIDRGLPEEARGTMSSALADMLGGLKPWAALSQLTILEFLPDMIAGRQPLDGLLYARAQNDDKTVGALETVDEQVAVFEAFTDQEQTRMLELTLDELDAAAKTGKRSSQTIIDRYLSGDLDKLAQTMTESMAQDRELSRKFTDLALDRRNVTMTDRILAKRAEQPDRVCFFAVGAGHYAGERGILALLAKKGLKVTRLPVQ